MTQKIWVTSDLHFGHENILNLGKGRPFNTIEDHDNQLIDNWNSVVSNGDLVYILGDSYLGVDGVYLERIFKQLKGNIHCIIGNHDRKKEMAHLLNMNLIQSLRDYHELRYRSEKDNKVYRFIMFHYPILEFNGAYKNGRDYVNCPTYIHLYGHIHDIVNYNDVYEKLGFNAYHVGVDTNDFKPIELETIIDKFRGK